MITEKISNEELEFMLAWHYPICLAESLFSDFNNQILFDENKFGEVRLYQHPLISSEGFIDTNRKDLSEKEQFELHKGAGDVYAYGSRKHGKTLCVEKIDIPLSMVYDEGFNCCFASADQIHLTNVLDCVINVIKFHPILKTWMLHFKGSPSYKLKARNGWSLDSVNMKTQSRDPGSQFYSQHYKKIWIEEASLETEEVYEKRKDAESEYGAVRRFSGMTNITKHSSAGRAFFDPLNKNKLCNLPQYVNPTFDKQEEERRRNEYGGRDTTAFRVFVDGTVIPDGISEIDMQRVEPYINTKIELKIFEIKKDMFNYFKNIIVVERPKNAERIFIAGDIGDGSGGSELIILSEIGNKYYYLYRIALINLKQDEQYEIIDWLIQRTEANVVALDGGDGTGRGIFNLLTKKYSINNLVLYKGTEKIGVDWKRNEKNEFITEQGRPVFLEEFQSEWSVRHLKALLYEGRILMPEDFKFSKQLNYVISRTVGTRMCYECVSPDGDHVWDAFKVFSIAQWLKKDFNSTPKLAVESGLGVSSWSRSIKIVIDKNKYRAMFEKREELQISKEDYNNGLRQFLLNETVKYSLENQPETLKYIQNQIQRLDKLHIGE